jgi:hypothetical protein
MTVRIVIGILVLDITLLMAGIYLLWIGKRMRAFAMPIIKTGIAAKGSGFHGRPEEDTEIHRAMGYAYLCGAIFLYVAGWFLLLMIPIIAVRLIYLYLFGSLP